MTVGFLAFTTLEQIINLWSAETEMHEGRLIEEVDIAELHKRNRKYTQFDLSDGQAAAKILESHYHITDFTVQGNTLKVYDFSHSIGDINRDFP